jgi:hypothetical protein
MEGADIFDFFRQPDFIKDPLLAGSYAVYKKETLPGEGTGKLCHIHRPEIIDSRGRRCRGDLSISGDKLCIAIPEGWLAEAKYPVIVDPTIGTATVGSQTHWNNVDNKSYDQLFIELSVAVNRFLVNETFSGTVTAYVYAYDGDYDGRCKPALYSDYGGIPLARKSKQEGAFDIAVSPAKPAGWRSAAFQSNGTITQGSYVWFGLFCEWFAPRFDFGMKCYKEFWDSEGDDIPETYPLYSAGRYYDFKLSAYFSYSTAQNYSRILAQGVALTDTRKPEGNYRRSVTQTAGGTGVVTRLGGFYRSIVEAVRNTMSLKVSPTLMIRLIEAAAVLYETQAGAGYKRGIGDTAGNNSVIHGMAVFFRALFSPAKGGDSTGGFITRMRVIQDTETVGDERGHTVDYLRGLFDEAGNTGETTRRGEYYRVQEDTAYSEGVSLRHLFIFLRLLTGAYIRDYIIGRFLRSKEELVIKSPVCREITLGSSLH